MYILGLSFFYHESAAALVKDGVLIAAAAEERFSRKKHDSGFPTQSVKFCLEEAGIGGKDLDFAVFYEKPFLKFERLLLSCISSFPSSYKLFRDSMLAFLSEKIWVKSIIANRVGVERNKVLFVPHHLSHAASAFYCSPYQEAAVLTLDGVGEWSCGGLGVGSGTKISLFKELRFPHSLGLLYSAFTDYLGFEVNDGEYKVMGMAPYGEPKYAEKIYNLLKVAQNGALKLDMNYFTFHKSPSQNVAKKFLDLFGPPRERGSHFFTPSSNYPIYFGEKPTNYEELAERNQYFADIAASIQKVTEEVILKMVNYLYNETKNENLVMAGGVTLNSVANGRVVQESPFSGIFIQPAAGDDGGALGAALYIYHHVLGEKRGFVMEHPYWGKAYTEKEIRKFLEDKEIKYKYISDVEDLAGWIASRLSKGEVIALFQGRFEWGPRALGNRSILADPRKEEMKDIVNVKIKFREPYRPFAPVVLEEKADEYFEDNFRDNYPAKFMLTVCQVRGDKKKVIPAVTHVDGSARPQTIDRGTNPLYRLILEKFEKIAGVPVLLNTSFNLKGEPIVASPENAYNTFTKSGIDHLILERFVISKNAV